MGIEFATYIIPTTNIHQPPPRSNRLQGSIRPKGAAWMSRIQNGGFFCSGDLQHYCSGICGTHATLTVDVSGVLYALCNVYDVVTECDIIFAVRLLHVTPHFLPPTIIPSIHHPCMHDFQLLYT